MRSGVSAPRRGTAARDPRAPGGPLSLLNPGALRVPTPPGLGKTGGGGWDNGLEEQLSLCRETFNLAGGAVRRVSLEKAVPSLSSPTGGCQWLVAPFPPRSQTQGPGPSADENCQFGGLVAVSFSMASSASRGLQPEMRGSFGDLGWNNGELLRARVGPW